MPSSSTPSLLDVSRPCSVYRGVREFQIPKYSSGPKWRAFTPSLCTLSSGGLAMSTAWTTAASPKDYSMTRFPQASAHLDDPSCAIKTYWRHCLSNAAFPIHLGRVRRGPSCLAFPCKISRGYLWGETHQRQKEETAEKERHWELLLPAWLSPAHPLSPLQQTFPGEHRPDQPSPHKPHPPWNEVLVIFAREGRTH